MVPVPGGSVRLAANRTPQRVRSGKPATESYLEREHNARWAVLGVTHATSGITANVLTLPLPRSILARDQLYLCNERMC